MCNKKSITREGKGRGMDEERGSERKWEGNIKRIKRMRKIKEYEVSWSLGLKENACSKKKRSKIEGGKNKKGGEGEREGGKENEGKIERGGGKEAERRKEEEREKK